MSEPWAWAVVAPGHGTYVFEHESVAMQHAGFWERDGVQAGAIPLYPRPTCETCRHYHAMGRWSSDAARRCHVREDISRDHPPKWYCADHEAKT